MSDVAYPKYSINDAIHIEMISASIPVNEPQQCG